MWIIIISCSVRKLPYTMRSSVGILYQIERSVEEASISLGVPPMKTFCKTTVVLMLPGVLSGAVLSFISCINELSSTLVLYTGKTSTISLAIFNAVTNDAYGQASALATILTVTTVSYTHLAQFVAASDGHQGAEVALFHLVHGLGHAPDGRGHRARHHKGEDDARQAGDQQHRQHRLRRRMAHRAQQLRGNAGHHRVGRILAAAETEGVALQRAGGGAAPQFALSLIHS